MHAIVKLDGHGERRIALPGSGSLMEAMRAAGLSVLADCGGVCACATCHVHVDLDWLGRLPPMDDNEMALLEFTEGADRTSRLSCRIPLSDVLDGLRVGLPSETVR